MTHGYFSGISSRTIQGKAEIYSTALSGLHELNRMPLGLNGGISGNSLSDDGVSDERDAGKSLMYMMPLLKDQFHMAIYHVSSSEGVKF